MRLRTRVVNKIEEVAKEEWDSVFPESLEGYNFLKALDETGFRQFSFCYILVYDGKSLVGAASCFFMKYSLATSISGRLRKALNFIERFLPGIFSVRAVVCGMPMGQGHIGMAGNGKEILDAIIRRMEQIARRRKAGIVAFKDFPRRYAPLLDPLIEKGFFKADSLPYAEMEIDFKTFDEYLKRLSSASRYDLRRKFKKASALAKIDMEIRDNLDDASLVEVYDLYMQIVEKHEMGFEVVPIHFFRSVAANMPKETKFFLWHADGKLAAFLLAFVSDGLFVDYYLGLDYAVAHKYHLFFIKHRDVMTWCLENGIRKYEMGFSGYEPKRRLGFDFTPLNIYARHRNPVINRILKLLTVFLKFENFDPDLKHVKRRLGEKRAPDIKDIRPDNSKRPAGQRGPAMHEERVGADRD